MKSHINSRINVLFLTLLKIYSFIQLVLFVYNIFNMILNTNSIHHGHIDIASVY